MAARFIVQTYENRKGNARASVLMSDADARALAVGNSDVISKLVEAFEKKYEALEAGE